MPGFAEYALARVLPAAGAFVAMYGVLIFFIARQAGLHRSRTTSAFLTSILIGSLVGAAVFVTPFVLARHITSAVSRIAIAAMLTGNFCIACCCSCLILQRMPKTGPALPSQEDNPAPPKLTTRKIAFGLLGIWLAAGVAFLLLPPLRRIMNNDYAVASVFIALLLAVQYVAKRRGFLK